MPIPERKTFPTQLDDLYWLATDDGSRSLIHSATGVSYHSGCGAISESLVVYLKNSGVAQRLLEGRETNVFEFGFGTGTSLLLTAAMAEHYRTQVELAAIEHRLLPASMFNELKLADSLASVKACWPVPSPLTDAIEQTYQVVDSLESRWVSWVEAYSAASSSNPGLSGSENEMEGEPTVVNVQLGEYATLRLYLMDWLNFRNRHLAEAVTGELVESFDAVYFDPFCPETSPELWSESVFCDIHRLLQCGGAVASYCVKGEIRRRMEAVGFEIEKLPGPIGGKREVLVARKP